MVRDHDGAEIVDVAAQLQPGENIDLAAVGDGQVVQRAGAADRFDHATPAIPELAAADGGVVELDD